MNNNSNFTIPKITRNKRQIKKTVRQGKAHLNTILRLHYYIPIKYVRENII